MWRSAGARSVARIVRVRGRVLAGKDENAMSSGARILAERGDDDATAGTASVGRPRSAEDRCRVAMTEYAQRQRARVREILEREFPRGPVSFDSPAEFMAHMADQEARELAHSERARVLLRAKFIEEAPVREKEEAVRLGRMLLHNSDGPFGDSGPGRVVKRGEREPEPPARDETSEPAWLVNRMCATESGCRWLLDRWTELAAEFEPGRRPCWQFEEDFKAIRLMGRQPHDAVTDPEVAEVFLASYELDCGRRSPFIELQRRVACAEMKLAIEQLSVRTGATGNGRDPIDGRQRLCALIDRATARLRSRIEQFLAPAEVEKAREALEEASDSADEIQRLDRYIKQQRRSLAQSRNFRPPDLGEFVLLPDWQNHRPLPLSTRAEDSCPDK
jgi:hypothetical protein